MSAKKRVPGSVKNKITNSDLVEERANKNFEGGLEVLIREGHVERYFDAIKFMYDHPELMNTFEFYDMTRQEQQKDLMRRAHIAYKYGREKWFHNHEPHEVHWAYV